MEDEYIYKKTRENLKIHIENMLERGEIFRKIKERVDEIVESLYKNEIEYLLRNIIRKYFPPNIIYVHELPERPQQLKNFAVKETFIHPVVPCVYFLCRDDKIVYIGQTTNIGSRLGSHATTKGFDRVFYMEVKQEDLKKTESELIEYYNPELNKTIRQIDK